MQLPFAGPLTCIAAELASKAARAVSASRVTVSERMAIRGDVDSALPGDQYSGLRLVFIRVGSCCHEHVIDAIASTIKRLNLIN